MSVLLKKIQSIDANAARILKQATFDNDSEILTLTREDLNELFPGPEKLWLRKTIFETIHKQKPIDTLLNELQGFIPHDYFKAALNNNGVLVDYLHILKDMKTQLNNVEYFLGAHIDLLEKLSTGQLEQQQDVFGGGHSDMQKSNLCGTPSCGSAADGWETLDLTNDKSGQKEASSQKTQTKAFHRSSDLSDADKNQHKKQVTVNYKMVVSGITFGAHQQILDQMQNLNRSQPLNLVNIDENQTSEVCHVTFVFCPVVSRVGTDVEAAMRGVKGSESVILFLMHHSHEAKHVASFKTWEYHSNLLHYNVFYHEKANGLIACKENDDVILAIRSRLPFLQQTQQSLVPS